MNDSLQRNSVLQLYICSLTYMCYFLNILLDIFEWVGVLEANNICLFVDNLQSTSFLYLYSLFIRFRVEIIQESLTISVI